MYLDHRAALRIARVLEQIDIPALLMDDQGNVILPEGDQRQLTLPEAVRQNPTEPMLYGGVTLIGARGEHSARDEQQLFLCLNGDGAEVRNCAVLCAELIGMILRVDMGHTDRDQALRLILRGETDGTELESLAAAHDIPVESGRCVIYLHARELTGDQVTKQLRTLIDEEADMLTEVGRHSVALVKALPENPDYDELGVQVQAFDAAFQDAGVDVMIGVSEPRALLRELPDAFSEAREAINVGSVYRATDRVFIYRRLLLERFLDTVAQPSASSFGAMIFNNKTARLFNDEMVHTIEVFFENNLNLSEAARKLYIHRNTLVYRLEKVQRLTGFDLREFDDAVTFKLMMLLSKNTGSRKMRV